MEETQDKPNIPKFDLVRLMKEAVGMTEMLKRLRDSGLQFVVGTPVMSTDGTPVMNAVGSEFKGTFASNDTSSLSGQTPPIGQQTPPIEPVGPSSRSLLFTGSDNNLVELSITDINVDDVTGKTKI